MDRLYARVHPRSQEEARSVILTEEGECGPRGSSSSGTSGASVRVLHAHSAAFEPGRRPPVLGGGPAGSGPGSSSRKPSLLRRCRHLAPFAWGERSEGTDVYLLLPGNPGGLSRLRNYLERTGTLEADAPCVPGRSRAYGLLGRSRYWVRLLEPDSLPPDVRLGDSLRYWQRASQPRWRLWRDSRRSWPQTPRRRPLRPLAPAPR